jgi:redox-sensitive bicupin YhaK (pirin superfamily)
MLVLPADYRAKVRATSDARLVVLGGEPMDGPGTFGGISFSSSKDRIEQAKLDWKLGRFAVFPAKPTSIPLPE